MANSKLLKEAIADAKAVRETAIANAKIALEEAFTPKLQSILSKKLQAEMNEEEDEEEVDESVDSSEIGKGGEPDYDEAHTELDPETEKETAAPGEELDAVEKVDDLKEGEDSEEEVEETVSEENEAEVKEETEVNEEEDSEEEANEGYKEEDDEEEVDEELNLEDIIKELESELSEEEGEDEEEVEELHGDKEGSHGEEEGSHGEEEMADMDEMEDEKEDDMDEDIDLDEILKEMGYGEEEGEEEMKDMEESNKVEELSKELEEAYATVKELKSTINEVNLLNAKLLYANKLFRSYAMNNDQKSKVVETLDRTKSVREVKLVFATLAESMKFGGETKRKVRVTEGIASKPQASTAPKKEIISESNEIANRFKKLANIK